MLDVEDGVEGPDAVNMLLDVDRVVDKPVVVEFEVFRLEWEEERGVVIPLE